MAKVNRGYFRKKREKRKAYQILQKQIYRFKLFDEPAKDGLAQLFHH